MNSYVPKNIDKDCPNHAISRWNQVQEAAAKALNAVVKNNRLGIPLLVFDMYLNTLIVLSFINKKPYTTFAKFIEEAGMFHILPEHFKDLTQIVVEGGYQNTAMLKKITEQVFIEFENILYEMGFDPYYDNVDPNKPMDKWR